MEIVINKCYGGFNLSVKGQMVYCEKKHGQAYLYKAGEERGMATQVPYTDDCTSTLDYYISPEDHKGMVDLSDINCIWRWEIERDDPALIATVKELGEEANGNNARLKIVEIPDEVGDNWHIDNYDGMETIHENHRSWS
jgi:hypothetical protein